MRRKYSPLILAVSGLVIGCSPMKLPPYPVRPVGQYRNVRNENGIAATAYPLTDKDESKKYFGVDLLSARILAVLVVVENRNPSQHFILFKDKAAMRLTDAGSSGPGTSAPGSFEFSRKPEEAAQAVQAGTAAVETATAAYGLANLVPVNPIFLPGHVAAASLALVVVKSAGDAEAIDQHFRDEELQTTTVMPGASVNGFLYMQLPKNESAKRQYVLHLELLEPRTQSVTKFDFPIEVPRHD